MKDINKNYSENIKELEKWISSLPITCDSSGDEELKRYAILINPSDMTELIIHEENGTRSEYTIPFLSLFNIAMEQLSKTAINLRSDSYTIEYQTETGDIVGISVNPTLDNVYRIQNSVTHICNLPSGFTLNHYLLFFGQLDFNEFRTIPRLFHNLPVFKSGKEYREYLDNRNIPGNLNDLVVDLDCRSLLGIISDSLFTAACTGMVIRKCKLCGKYFVTENRSDEMYCRFPNESYSNKPCKDAYKRIAQDERERGNEALQLNKRIYNRLRNRSKTSVTQYIKERDKRKPTDKNDSASLAKYIDWLQEYDRETRKR